MQVIESPTTPRPFLYDPDVVKSTVSFPLVVTTNPTSEVLSYVPFPSSYFIDEQMKGIILDFVC